MNTGSRDDSRSGALFLVVLLAGALGCGRADQGGGSTGTPTGASGPTMSDDLALEWRERPERCRFASFDVPGGTDTNGFGVNDLAQIVGRFTGSDGVVKGFLRQPSGRFEILEFPGASFTAPIDINNLGVVVGRYLDQGGVSHGFVLRYGHYSTLDYPGAIDTRIRGIDDRGRVVGNFRKDDGVEHGFNLDGNGFAQVDFPGSATTDVWDINDLGVRIGDWTDVDGNVHAYVLRDGQFRSFDSPGRVLATSARRINLMGVIAGVFAFDDFLDHGFLRSGDRYRQIDFPGAAETDAFGINLWGLVVGDWIDQEGGTHRYVLRDCAP